MSLTKEEQERQDQVAMHIVQIAAYLRDGISVEQLRAHYLQAMPSELFDTFYDAAVEYNKVRSEQDLAAFVKEEQAKRAEVSASSAKTTQIMIGLGVAALGAIISYVSFDSVSDTGGHYVIFYGAVIWGLWFALKGLFK